MHGAFWWNYVKKLPAAVPYTTANSLHGLASQSLKEGSFCSNEKIGAVFKQSFMVSFANFGNNSKTIKDTDKQQILLNNFE